MDPEIDGENKGDDAILDEIEQESGLPCRCHGQAMFLVDIPHVSDHHTGTRKPVDRRPRCRNRPVFEIIIVTETELASGNADHLFPVQDAGHIHHFAEQEYSGNMSFCGIACGMLWREEDRLQRQGILRISRTVSDRSALRGGAFAVQAWLPVEVCAGNC